MDWAKHYPSQIGKIWLMFKRHCLETNFLPTFRLFMCIVTLTLQMYLKIHTNSDCCRLGIWFKRYHQETIIWPQFQSINCCRYLDFWPSDLKIKRSIFIQWGIIKLSLVKILFKWYYPGLDVEVLLSDGWWSLTTSQLGSNQANGSQSISQLKLHFRAL